MSDNVKPLLPLKVNIDVWNQLKLSAMILVTPVLWVILIVAGINLLAYYVHSVITNGFFDTETLKYAVIVAVGAYSCLILDKNKIYEALNVKRDLLFITSEQIEEKKKR